MTFDAVDARMRMFETAHDHCVLPGMYMVARLDGRSFTRLTREVHQSAAPFDERFRDLMRETTAHVMRCGFRMLYDYTQSDEISLLVHRDEQTFGRKLRKYESILAGEASAKFALLRGAHAAFDCRISQLPNAEPVVDYFRWRSAGAHRNALNGHGYWLLRKQGKSTIQTTTALLHLSVAQKNELLFQAGTNFNDVPLWHRRGIGLYWETYEKPAYNPKTGEPVAAVRRRLQGDYQLPMKERYSDFIATLLAAASSTMHGEHLIHSREEQQS